MTPTYGNKGIKFRLLINLTDHCSIDPPEVIGLFQELLPADFRKRLEYPSPPPTLSGSEMEKGYAALIQYLLKVISIMHVVQNCFIEK